MGLRAIFPKFVDYMLSSTPKQKHTMTTTTPPGGNRLHSRATWSQVAARNIVSCHDSHQKLSQPHPDQMDEDTPTTSKYAHRRDDLFYDVLTPYIVGLEPDSVLIDVTEIANLQKLKTFLGNLNSEERYPFYGTLLVERRYLKRRFIETSWDRESPEYDQLISTGLTMDDNTIIRGYPSLSAEAKIARVKIERLPLCHPRKLRDMLTQRFSSIGEVLDIGFHMDGKVFFGQGYVVLNLKPTGFEVTESLTRVLPWPSENRQLLLTWDEMPPYCRYCQKDDHCRADCTELLRTKHCFECNELGHIIRDCPRRNRNNQVQHKRVAVAVTKSRKVPVNATAIVKTPPPSPKLMPTKEPVAEKCISISTEKLDEIMEVDGSEEVEKPKQNRATNELSAGDDREAKKFKNNHKEASTTNNHSNESSNSPIIGDAHLTENQDLNSSNDENHSFVTTSTIPLLQ